MKRLFNKWVLIVLAVALAVGGLYVYRRFFARGPVNNQRSSMLIPATRGEISVEVAAGGSVEASVVQDVTAAARGTLLALYVEEGDSVKKGDTIAVLDDDSLQQEIEAIEENLKRQEKAYDDLVKSLEDFYVKAPVDGRIKSLKAKVGEDAGTTMKVHGALAVISTAEKMLASIRPENNVSLQKGELVDLVFEDGSVIHGRVSDSVSGLTIEVDSDEYPIGSKVSVLNKNGIFIGEGTLELKEKVSVTVNTGFIDEIYVKENDRVKIGDKLFKLDSSDIEEEMDSLKKEIEKLKEDLAEKKAQLDDLTVTAPIDGIITSLPAETGDELLKGSTIATIMDLTRMQLKVSVDELDITKIQPGQKATMTLDALPDRTYEGEVVKIKDVGQYSSGVTTYEVLISIKDPEGIRVGMSANAKIQTAHKENAVLVPVEAVMQIGGESFVMVGSPAADSPSRPGSRNQGGMRAVQPNPGSFSREAGPSPSGNLRKVEVGIMNEDYAEIVSGLEEGELVVVQSTTSSGGNGGFGGFRMGREIRVPAVGSRPQGVWRP